MKKSINALVNVNLNLNNIDISVDRRFEIERLRKLIDDAINKWPDPSLGHQVAFDIRVVSEDAPFNEQVNQMYQEYHERLVAQQEVQSQQEQEEYQAGEDEVIDTPVEGTEE